MKPHTILYWTVGIVAGLMALAALGTANLWGITLAIPALYAIPHQIRRWRIAQAMRRELTQFLNTQER